MRKNEGRTFQFAADAGAGTVLYATGILLLTRADACLKLPSNLSVYYAILHNKRIKLIPLLARLNALVKLKNHDQCNSYFFGCPDNLYFKLCILVIPV